MLQTITQETLDRARSAAIQALKDPALTRSISVGTGLVGFNLQAPAKQLVALQSPFYQSIVRKVKEGANADNWRVITALGSPDPFTTENAAASQFATTLSSKVGNFKVNGVQGVVTLEAVKASQGFDPALAKETVNTLLVAMKLQEQAFFGGNITALGDVAAPTVALSTSAGNITAGATTYFVRIAPLTVLAANRAPLVFPADTNSNSENLLTPVGLTQAQLQAITSLPTATNPNPGTAFSTGCGMGRLQNEGNSGSVTPTNKALKITWTPVAGAVAYAIFVGTVTGAANLGLQCVVTQTQVCLTTLIAVGASAVAGNDAAVPTTDQTANANHFDGIIAQLNAGGSGAYIKNLNGTLTGTNNEILEIQDAMAQIFSTAKIGKFRVIVGGNDARILSRLGVKTGTMTIMVSPQLDGRQALVAGAKVTEIVNSITGDSCMVETQPWLPPGTILILPTDIPYPNANVANPFEWVGSYDWMRWEYASTQSTGPIYPFENRCNGVLEGLFTGGCGVIYNVWKG